MNLNGSRIIDTKNLRRLYKGHRARILATLLLSSLFFFVIAWLYKAYILAALCLVWRKQIRSRYGRRGWRGLLCFALLAVFCVMPRYRTGSSDKVRLIFYNGQGEAVHPPLFHYICNLVIPEEEVCHIACLAARYIPDPIKAMPPELHDEIKSLDSMSEFYGAYKRLNWGGSFTVSGVTPQIMCQAGFKPRYRSVYLIRPDDCKPGKSYPLVVFAHGFLGNWKLYQGILSGLENCFVLSVGTADLSGYFTEKDIRDVFSVHLPLLENMGCKIDRSRIHILGLSNGLSAAAVSCSRFARQFRSVTFISCTPDKCYRIPGKLLMIGGGKDASSAGQPQMYRKLKEAGVDCSHLWFADKGHLIFATRRGKIADFLNRELGLAAD